jgi:hypothetical protein
MFLSIVESFYTFRTVFTKKNKISGVTGLDRYFYLTEIQYIYTSKPIFLSSLQKNLVLENPLYA